MLKGEMRLKGRIAVLGQILRHFNIKENNTITAYMDLSQRVTACHDPPRF
jgi:hypothetical protein